MLKYLIAALWLPVAALAQNMDYGSVKLLKGWQAEDGSYQIALEFSLNEGWKTYWRSPGPAGLPPVFNWEASDNIGTVGYAWPTPEIIDQSGMITLGYHDQFILPIRITPENDGPVRVALTLNFGVCSDICVPAQAAFLARLDGSADQAVARIEAALQKSPQNREAAGLERIDCTVAPKDNGYEITANLGFSEAIEAPFTVIEYGTQEFWIDMTKSETRGAAISASAPMQYYGSGEMNMDMAALTVSVFGADRAVEIRGCVE
jgi:DsbC/DsbD-like thiol-disulfide interchange protein